VGCNSNENNPVIQKKLDAYFENSSNVNLDKEIRLKYIDSAKNAIQKASDNDSIKIKNYFKLANRYFILLEYEKYKETTNTILEISTSNKDSLNIAKAEYYLGDYYFSLSKNDSAYYYYLGAEKKYEKIDDKSNLARTILHKAYILLYEKDFLGSESETIKVLNIAKEIKDESLVYESYVNLGSSLSGLGNYEKALEYHQKALTQIKNIEDENYKPVFQAQTLNNIGFVYLSINKFNEASQIFAEGLKIENLKDIQPVLYASLVDNYGYSVFKIDKNKGLQDFQKALAVRDEIGDILGKINSRIHLTEYYLSQNDTLKALQLNSEANKLAKESHYNKEVLVTLDFFTKLIPQEGLSYAREYIKLNDSLQKQERATRNKLARIEFETDEIISEKETLSNQRKIILITSLLIISFGFLLYVILYQRSKHKELVFTQQQQESNEEIYRLMLNNQEDIDEVRSKVKRNIALELHDNILNRLASTRLNLFAISRRQDEETIKKAIEHIDSIREIEQEIRTFSHELHRESEINKSNFRNILEELLKNQKEIYPAECNCDIFFDDAMNNMSPEIKMNVYRIIQEAFNNINKYANATKIGLALDVEKGFLHLEINDNGVGFNVKKVKNGIGLKNMKNRAEAMKGEISIVSERDKGTTIKLKIPI
jgi:signal transduction histidine kinase